jgi:hypothetical protein
MTLQELANEIRAINKQILEEFQMDFDIQQLLDREQGIKPNVWQ